MPPQASPLPVGEGINGTAVNRYGFFKGIVAFWLRDGREIEALRDGIVHGAVFIPSPIFQRMIDDPPMRECHAPHETGSL